MKNIADFLELLMDKTGFPEDSKDTFRDIHTKLLNNPSAAARFDAICTQIDNGARKEALADADALAESLDVHPYSMELYVFMAKALPLRAQYKAAGYDEQVYWDSMTDLRAKLMECRDVYEINGSFVASWFPGFFEMTRFALGRLQFEITTFNEDKPYICGEYTVHPGDKVVNIHIPSLGPLPTESVLDALARAYRFPYFKDVRVGESDVKAFVCHSWLLYPKHRDFLPPHLNILKFMDCFDIIDFDEEHGFGNQWRVFGKYKDAAPEALPTDTSLRRAYAERLRQDGLTGNGHGILLFDGEKILKSR